MGWQSAFAAFFEAGNTTIINSQGLFVYAGIPALGNLLSSISSTATVTTDAYGNTIFPGTTNIKVSAGNYYAINTGVNNTLSFLTAPSAGGPWTNNGGIGQGASSLAIITSSLGINGTVTATGGTPTTPSVLSTDSWNSMTLLNSWANVAGFAVCRYRMLASPPNSVEVQGTLNAAAASAVTFATLPLGYIPASQQTVCSAGANASVPAGLSPWIRCDTSGNLTVQNTGAIPAAFQLFFHGFIALTN